MKAKVELAQAILDHAKMGVEPFTCRFCGCQIVQDEGWHKEDCIVITAQEVIYDAKSHSG